MSEYDSLVEGYEGLGSPDDDPGPLNADEEVRMQELLTPIEEIEVRVDEPEPFVEGDGFDPQPPEKEIRHLRSDASPRAGFHYVIVDGVPKAVVKGYPQTEDEYVRQYLDDITDHVRAQRAGRSLRMRYRRYLAGESSNL